MTFFIDPKLIAFIRKRNKKEGEEIIRINEQSIIENMDIDNQTNIPIEVDSRWIHMNNIENEKLEWMKDLPKPSAQRTADDSVGKILLINDFIFFFLFHLEFRRCTSAF